MATDGVDTAQLSSTWMADLAHACHEAIVKAPQAFAVHIDDHAPDDDGRPFASLLVSPDLGSTRH